MTPYRRNINTTRDRQITAHPVLRRLSVKRWPAFIGNRQPVQTDYHPAALRNRPLSEQTTHQFELNR